MGFSLERKPEMPVQVLFEYQAPKYSVAYAQVGFTCTVLDLGDAKNPAINAEFEGRMPVLLRLVFTNNETGERFMHTITGDMSAMRLERRRM